MTDTYPHDLVGEPAPPPTRPSARVIASARAAQARAAGELAPPTPPRGASADRVAGSIVTLVSEANAANSSRDKTSDGTWGDKRHQALGNATDHNPWLKVAGVGYVRAGDFDVDGLDVAGAFERGRAAAVAGRLPQVVDGGYFIVNRRITAPDFSGWHDYTGSDPHVLHGHVSVSVEFGRFDSRAPWGIWLPTAAPPPPPPAPSPAGWTGPDAIGRGVGFRATFIPGPRSNGQRMADLQAFLRRVFPAYAGDLAVDGWYGQQTAGVVAEFARRSGIAGADGNNVGPKIAAALWRVGFDR